MSEKLVHETRGEAVETPPSPVDKSQVYHDESVIRAERNVGLRIDGDDLDHEHEPKVF
jgi:hypothetical protein